VHQREFTAEVNIHFPGMDGLTKPTVLVFPQLSVCLGCGVAHFDVPDAELKRLADEQSVGQSQSYRARA
jgi:hypothetical protein